MAENEQPDLIKPPTEQLPSEADDETLATPAEEPSPSDDEMEKGKFFESKRNVVMVAIAGVALLAVFGAAAFGNKVGASNEKQQTKTETLANPSKSTETSTSEKESQLSESESRYADYLKTLSPEQRAVRESLNPDALAVMNDAQLAEAFTIKSKEVVVDGKIDPLLYTEAMNARISAMDNSGLSSKEYDKWGGLDKFGTNVIDEVADKYYKTESKALFGFVNTNPTLTVALALGSSVDQIINSKLSPKPAERYHYRSTVEPSSVESTIGANGYLDITFLSHASDNWDTKAMTQYNLERLPWDSQNKWYVTGLHVTDDGAVWPTSIK